MEGGGGMLPYWVELPSGQLINLCLVRDAYWATIPSPHGTPAYPPIAWITMADGAGYEVPGDTGQRLIDLIRSRILTL